MKMIDKGRLIEWADERWRQAWATQIADFNGEDDEGFKLYIISESTRYNERAQVLSEIRLFPAVNVVRCEDCRKRGGEDCPMYHWQDILIYQGDDICDEDHEITDNTEDSGFCHKGERRSDD